MSLLDIDVPNEHHPVGEKLTAWDLAEFSQSPFIYNQRRAGMLPNAKRKESVTGLAVHTLAFSGREIYDQRYEVNPGPINSRTDAPYGSQTKKYREWREKFIEETGKTPLTQDQSALIESMAHNLKINPAISALLPTAHRRFYVEAEYCGLPFGLTYDLIDSSASPGLWWADLKTTMFLEGFEEELEQRNYWIEWALLNAVLKQQHGADVPLQAFVIASERENGCRSAIWMLDQFDLWEQDQGNRHQISRYKQCRATDDWQSGFENVRLLRRNRK